MAEYIGRGAVRNAILGEHPDMHYPSWYANIIDSIPAADVAPVVHGEWIIGVDNDDFDVKCSKCEWTDIFEVAGISAVERIAKAMHYCPNCGAKMDGGVSGATNLC